MGGGNSLALIEEIEKLKNKFVIKSVSCTFSDGYVALDYSELGILSGFAAVFVQEIYGRNLPTTSTTYSTQAANDKLILYGRVYNNGNIALASGNRLLNLIFIY